MLKRILNSKFGVIAAFCVFSLLGGAVNGFLGTGGGIIFVYMLTSVAGVNKKDAFATALCATVPISAITLFTYARVSQVDFSLIGRIWLPALVGGLFGAFLVEKLNTVWLNIIFASLVIYSGACLILR